MSEDNAPNHTSQFSLDFARREGLKIVLPGAQQLQIDIDSDAQYAQFEEAFDRARELGLGLKGFSVRPSRSGGERRHVTVECYVKVTALERIALQAILGSDWKREMYSYARLQEGEAIPTLFFEKE